jgi:hypothetical protein
MAVTVRGVIGLVGRAFRELARGLWLLAQDAHSILYKKYGPRIYWAYLAILAVVVLFLTGTLIQVLTGIAILAIVIMGLWFMAKGFTSSKKTKS